MSGGAAHPPRHEAPDIQNGSLTECTPMCRLESKTRLACHLAERAFISRDGRHWATPLRQGGRWTGLLAVFDAIVSRPRCRMAVLREASRTVGTHRELHKIGAILPSGIETATFVSLPIPTTSKFGATSGSIGNYWIVLEAALSCDCMTKGLWCTLHLGEPTISCGTKRENDTMLTQFP